MLPIQFALSDFSFHSQYKATILSFREGGVVSKHIVKLYKIEMNLAVILCKHCLELQEGLWESDRFSVESNWSNVPG